MFTTKKRAVVSVINDLVTDSRVQKTCTVLTEAGYEVLVIGRKLPDSLPIPEWNYKAVRMHLLFRKGPLFYFFFNLRLFFKLLFIKADLLFANDLDTLWPNYQLAKLKRINLIYDSHELFCEVPELANSPIKKKIWERLEGSIVPKLRHCITVNQSIANIFKNKYQVTFEVIRNIPSKTEFVRVGREKLGLPMNKKVVLMQGAGINIDRGAEELVKAMAEVDEAMLLIIGGGDVWKDLEVLISELHLENKVRLIKKLPKKELLQYTVEADLGISIDKNSNLNYYNSLPNKIFDYLQAGVPVLCSPLPELEKVIKLHDSGWFIDSHDPKELGKKIKSILNSDELLRKRENALLTSEELSWSKEKEKYLSFIKAIQS